MYIISVNYRKSSIFHNEVRAIIWVMGAQANTQKPSPFEFCQGKIEGDRGENQWAPSPVYYVCSESTEVLIDASEARVDLARIISPSERNLKLYQQVHCRGLFIIFGHVTRNSTILYGGLVRFNYQYKLNYPRWLLQADVEKALRCWWDHRDGTLVNRR